MDLCFSGDALLEDGGERVDAPDHDLPPPLVERDKHGRPLLGGAVQVSHFGGGGAAVVAGGRLVVVGFSLGNFWVGGGEE